MIPRITDVDPWDSQPKIRNQFLRPVITIRCRKNLHPLQDDLEAAFMVLRERPSDRMSFTIHHVLSACIMRDMGGK
jgi:hypothetical protein